MKRLLQNPLGAMLCKEVRENVVWAVLGALVLLLVNYMVIFDYTQTTLGIEPNQSVFSRWVESNMVPIYTTWVTALSGAVLGFMQVSPELRRDQWAFLIHRPLSLKAIFWSKAMAGLLLYFVFIGGTFLLLWAMVWSTCLRDIPQLTFDWRFMVGGLADILAGVPCYFAAMLCAVRVTRWYGSRFIPLISCIPLAAYAALLPEFYHCLVLVLTYSLVMILAARSNFEGQGQYRAQTKGGRLVLGFSLLPGLLTLATAFLLLAGGWLGQLLPYIEVQRSPGNISVRYGVLPNGEIVQEVDGTNPSWTIIKNLEGHQKKVASGQVRFFREGVRNESWVGFRDVRRYLLHYYFSYGYSIHRHSTILYSAKQRRFLLLNDNLKNVWGYIGPDGYYGKDAATPLTSRFPGEFVGGLSRGYLWFSDELYRLAADGRTIQHIAPATNIESIAHHSVLESKQRPYPYLSREQWPKEQIREMADESLIVVKAAKIDFYNAKNKLLFSVPRVHDALLYSRIWTERNIAGNRYYVLYMPGSEVPIIKQRELPLYLDIYNEKGAVIDQHTLPPSASGSGTPSLTWWQVYNFGPVMPLAILAGYAAFLLSGVVTYGVAPSLWLSELALRMPDIVMMMQLSFTTALISCIVLWLLRRRSGLMKRSLLIWLIVVFLLGPVGLLLFLSMRGWPARVACPSCGELRAVDFNNCENCATPWPVRPKDSADIFPISNQATQ